MRLCNPGGSRNRGCIRLIIPGKKNDPRDAQATKLGNKAGQLRPNAVGVLDESGSMPVHGHVSSEPGIGFTLQEPA
jgi:hypothetical protein